MTLSASVNDYMDFVLALLRDPTVAAGSPTPWDDTKDVYEGDQRKIPRYPTICVEPGTKTREMYGAQRQMLLNTDIDILVYIGRVDDPNVNQREAVDIGEYIEDQLHINPRLRTTPSDDNTALAYHSFVTSLEPGYATRSGVLLRAVRLRFNVQSQQILPQVP